MTWRRRNKRPRNACMRLRAAVVGMPVHARQAMLRGISENTIIVGAYTDPRSGGICPMLAAHRNGGRIDLGSFARSWDRYTGAEDPRPATPREIRTLVSMLESSLAEEVSLAGEEHLRRSSPRLAPPERPGLAYRIRRLRIGRRAGGDGERRRAAGVA